MIFPDTVLFEKNKPVLLVRCDKDFCLTGTKAQSKGQGKTDRFFTRLHSELSTVVRERKKNQNSVFQQIYMKQMQVEAINRLNAGEVPVYENNNSKADSF